MCDLFNVRLEELTGNDGDGLTDEPGHYSGNIWNSADGAQCNNSPTVFTGMSSHTINEDAGPYNIAVNFNDEDGAVSWTVGEPQVAGSTTEKSGESVRYTPASNYNGSDSFVITATDVWGDIHSFTINITVNPIDDTPIWSSNGTAFNVDAGSSITESISVTDPDGIPSPSAGNIQILTNPTNGTLSISATTVTDNSSAEADWTYTPNPDTAAGESDYFTLKIIDEEGTEATFTLTFVIQAPAGCPTGYYDSDDNPATDCQLCSTCEPGYTATGGCNGYLEDTQCTECANDYWDHDSDQQPIVLPALHRAAAPVIKLWLERAHRPPRLNVFRAPVLSLRAQRSRIQPLA